MSDNAGRVKDTRTDAPVRDRYGRNQLDIHRNGIVSKHWLLLSPLTAAGVIPGAWILMRNNKYRNKVFGTLVFGYLVHGAWLIKAKPLNLLSNGSLQGLSSSTVSKFHHDKRMLFILDGVSHRELTDEILKSSLIPLTRATADCPMRENLCYCME
ncbi:hypothetical protein PROFUN_14235 [Planoprotostelium fungivorum]|uniref:Uncharacterized protein n=1 Tax=Planoprotostelium fungivorum TaxID=1890364 RepID=A0A2P6N0S5_9EUKA|nr:hypothetical protein PROFUN_14235 [Planoprotostelium fungivorum]